ncbi:hypothetical protein BO86DRAFT_456944 [Aspergillus japonicus CBS 114.51]|uniref:Subtelomeric hrmA-associated cluster protein AFUB-079030/YDR124W-like helical bundle domain-containing protein n=1 Tax=Aspergillus japonicus CBS 114.51 TaxID=1448312 RepID=A0A8T8WZZ9_ASPJA|nr:hypothetical protein BO86DRAFT_456944 [Aspergillus japonicus CBS 114.51]RAH80879.1 hypothetical protein BO86DRAFT_456944 [Aspergillus japonicus CBS 114.51]
MAPGKDSGFHNKIFSNLHASSLTRLLLMLAENLYPEKRLRFSSTEQKPKWWPAEITYIHPTKLKKRDRLSVAIKILSSFEPVDDSVLTRFQRLRKQSQEKRRAESFVELAYSIDEQESSPSQSSAYYTSAGESRFDSGNKKD